jgi:hypothetical protein
VRYGATHILERDVCGGTICAIRQNYSENSLVVVAVCNLRDLPSIWWFTIIIMDLFYASLFYLCV